MYKFENEQAVWVTLNNGITFDGFWVDTLGELENEYVIECYRKNDFIENSSAGKAINNAKSKYHYAGGSGNGSWYKIPYSDIGWIQERK